jgi:hypothetical protein
MGQFIQRSAALGVALDLIGFQVLTANAPMGADHNMRNSALSKQFDQVWPGYVQGISDLLGSKFSCSRGDHDRRSP